MILLAWEGCCSRQSGIGRLRAPKPDKLPIFWEPTHTAFHCSMQSAAEDMMCRKHMNNYQHIAWKNFNNISLTITAGKCFVDFEHSTKASDMWLQIRINGHWYKKECIDFRCKEDLTRCTEREMPNTKPRSNKTKLKNNNLTGKPTKRVNESQERWERPGP